MTLFPSAAPDGRHPIAKHPLPFDHEEDAQGTEPLGFRTAYTPCSASQMLSVARTAVRVIDATAQLLPVLGVNRTSFVVRAQTWSTAPCGSDMAAWIAAVGILRQKAGIQ